MEMLFSIRYASVLGIGLVGLIGTLAYLFVNSASAQNPPLPEPRYELSGQILSRVTPSGMVELCLRTDEGEVLCPENRYLRPVTVDPDRWLRSSEISWQAPIDVDRIIYSVPELTPPPDDSTCAPDFERMLAATWKVETSRSLGTAFHIGGGRFITAHHVIERRPPFVSLIHGERTIGAAVLGFDAQHDLALLEVETPELLHDVPVMNLRTPTQEDVGQPVYLVGYPGGEALSLSGGGVVTQVWDDNIQTSSAVRGGNSGGPMFDACGDVIGVVWAGGSSFAYTNSGRAVLRSLQQINERWPSWPRMPESLPESLKAANRLVWHYDAEPPPGVDCSELDGDWWIGVSGVADEASVRADLGRAGWRQVGVCGAAGPEDFDNGRTWVAALEPLAEDQRFPLDCVLDPASQTESVIYQSALDIGDVRLLASEPTPDCPERNEFGLRLTFASPQVAGTDLGATLIGRDGSLLVGNWRGRSYQGVTDAPDALVVSFWQDWIAPAHFEPVALRLALGDERRLISLTDAPVVATVYPELTLDQRLRIMVRVDGSSGAISACLNIDGTIACPTDGGAVPYPGVENRWRESAPVVWTSPISIEATPIAEHLSQPVLSCSYRDPAELYAWQFNSLAGTGTAVYVGERQFLVNRGRLPDTAPWAVISRGETSVAVIRVANDPRNDIALVEVFDPDEEVELGASAVFGGTDESMLGTNVHLLSYPSGSAERFNLGVLNVSAVTERVFRAEPSGIGRHGAPLLDLCTSELLGVSIGGDDLLRAEVVEASLAAMRDRAERPDYSQDGPPAHGSAAAYGQPLYAGPIQPDFSGRICDVHPSERHRQYFAVYVSNIDNPDVWRVYENDGSRPDTCDFGDKIFIVEYRPDETPEAVCIEPRRPLSPVSTVEWELEAPDGVELLLAREFPRNDCPGLSSIEETRWFSTHYFKLRNTSKHDFEDFIVRVYNEEDKRHIPRRDVYTFADSDVWGWRVNVEEGQPVKVVVTVR